MKQINFSSQPKQTWFEYLHQIVIQTRRFNFVHHAIIIWVKPSFKFHVVLEDDAPFQFTFDNLLNDKRRNYNPAM